MPSNGAIKKKKYIHSVRYYMTIRRSEKHFIAQSSWSIKETAKDRVYIILPLYFWKYINICACLCMTISRIIPKEVVTWPTAEKVSDWRTYSVYPVLFRFWTTWMYYFLQSKWRETVIKRKQIIKKAMLMSRLWNPTLACLVMLLLIFIN
jgi:hypothetical protein